MSNEVTKKRKRTQAEQMEFNFIITLIVTIVLVAGFMLGYEVILDKEANSNMELVKDSSLTVKDGDKVHIDFDSYIDGVAYDGATTGGKGADLVIGSDTLTDMEQQLIGTHPGDKLEIYITFSEEYKNNKTLAGKKVLFKITVHGIYQEKVENNVEKTE